MKVYFLILALVFLGGCGFGNSKNGKDGRDGVDGRDGQRGQTGERGQAGENGANGKDGKNGLDGKNGVDGKDGVNGKDGLNGKDGEKGDKGDKGDSSVGKTITCQEDWALEFGRVYTNIFTMFSNAKGNMISLKTSYIDDAKQSQDFYNAMFFTDASTKIENAFFVAELKGDKLSLTRKGFGEVKDVPCKIN
jgi:hypothetical protein